MQEYTRPLSDLLANGLAPHVRYGRNMPYMEEMKGVVVSDGIVRPSPLAFGAQGFPFPQNVSAFFDPLRFDAAGVKRWTPGTGGTQSVSLFNPAAPATITTAQAAGQWHFADFFNAWYATNGESLLFATKFGGASLGAPKVYCNNTLKINTITEHKGRVLFGGITGTPWDAAWLAAFAEWGAESPSPITLNPSGEGMSSYIMWSSVGGGDLPLWLTYPLDYPPAQGPTTDAILERFRRNELGWAPMPFPGAVLRMEPLGDSVIVYGEGGVAAIRPTNAGASTYSVRSIYAGGVAGRGAVGSLGDAHIFVSANRDVYALAENLQLTRLEYQHFMRGLGSVVVSVDVTDKAVYISDADRTYVLRLSGDRYALTELTSSVASFVEYEGVVHATGRVGLDKELLMRTLPFDMDSSSIKSLNVVRLGCRHEYPLYVTVWYRDNRNSGWRRGKTTPVNKEGNAYVRTAGVDFAVEIQSDRAEGVEIDSIEVGYQLVDRRFHRGPSASAKYAGAGSE